MSKLLLVAVLIGHAVPLSQGLTARMIVWNVGQGSWATWSAPAACVHFDMGGERFNAGALAKECAGKNNFAAFSHWDWDHIGLVLKSRAALGGRLCIAAGPGGPANERKRLLLSRVPACERRLELSELKFINRSKNSNGASRVFFHRGVLLPGDSGVAQEKIWLHQLTARFVRALIVGHHGSRSSTSNDLLAKLVRLKFAVVSARERVYGHPHPIVQKRLKERGIGLVRTEDWGNVIFSAP